MSDCDSFSGSCIDSSPTDSGGGVDSVNMVPVVRLTSDSSEKNRPANDEVDDPNGSSESGLSLKAMNNSNLLTASDATDDLSEMSKIESESRFLRWSGYLFTFLAMAALGSWMLSLFLNAGLSGGSSTDDKTKEFLLQVAEVSHETSLIAVVAIGVFVVSMVAIGILQIFNMIIDQRSKGMRFDWSSVHGERSADTSTKTDLDAL